MHRQLLLLSLIMLFNHSSLSAQTKEEMLSFYKTFEPIEFDLWHIYTNGQQKKAIYNAKSSYPFNGKKIVGSVIPSLEKILTLDTGKEFFAVARYTISTPIEGLIVRIYDEDMLSNSIYNLAYNRKTNTITEGILLAYDYQAEGGSGAVQSWLFDLNKDGFSDVLTRTYYDRYDLKKDSEDLEHIHEEKTEVVIFEDLIFKNTVVNNKNLQQSLEQEFPYRPIQAPFLKEKTQKEILKLFKKGGLVIPSEHD